MRFDDIAKTVSARFSTSATGEMTTGTAIVTVDTSRGTMSASESEKLFMTVVGLTIAEKAYA